MLAGGCDKLIVQKSTSSAGSAWDGVNFLHSS